MAFKVEQIDDKIIKLLGLQEGDVLSYEDYYRELRELIAKHSFGAEKFSQEFLAFLVNERKRIAKTPGVFRVSTKKTKTQRKKPTKEGIKKFLKFSGSFADSVKPKEGVAKEQPKSTKITESIFDIVVSIRKSVEGIYETIKLQNALALKTFDRDRREKENRGRKKREEDLESSLQKVGSAVSKILAPVQGILDKIFRFIFFTLLNRTLSGLFDWLKDPENKRKFKSLIRFFSDHWKLFVGLFVLFGTSFGAFVRGMLKAVARGLVALAFHIPRIRRFLKRNPRLAMLGVGAATFGTGLLANTLNPPEAKKEGDNLKDVGKEDFDTAKQTADQASNVKVPTLRMGGMMPNVNLSVFGSQLGSRDKSKSGVAQKPSSSMSLADGIVGDRGVPFSGGGKDNRLFPTATGGFVGLSGKEFIVNEGGVTKETLPVLMAFNRMGAGAGANKPRMISGNNIKIGGAYNGGFLNIRGFNTGGSLGPTTKPTTSKPNSTKPKSNNQGFFGNMMQNVQNLGSSFFNKILSPAVGDPGRATQSPVRSVVQQPTPEHKKPEVQALLRTIKTAEHYKDADPYNAIYGGGSAPITKMTVKEVIDMGNTDMLPKRFGGKPAGYGSGSSATGAYQFMPFTLQDLIRRGAVKPNQIMVPDLQDKLGWQLIKNRGVNLGDLKGGLSSSILNKLAPEWASLPTLSGQSYYGQPVKPAATLQQVYNETLKKIAPPPGPPTRQKISSIVLPPQVIDNAKQQVASAISNEGDSDMVANIFSSESINKSKRLGLIG